MNQEQISESANILWQHWMRSEQIDELPDHCRPSDRYEAYAVQAQIAQLSGQKVFGWKIAATSKAGQKHIGVDGPLAGRLLSNKVMESGIRLRLGKNLMKVAEVEFAFQMRESLPPRAGEYSMEEVVNAVATLHPAIEIPDSRYSDFVNVGAAQLIADNACACWFVLGPATKVDWRKHDLAGHAVTMWRNDAVAAEGSGANVLDDPRIALTWIANELRSQNTGLLAGEVVTTGTCVLPHAIAPGDTIRADFGEFGTAVVEIA